MTNITAAIREKEVECRREENEKFKFYRSRGQTRTEIGTCNDKDVSDHIMHDQVTEHGSSFTSRDRLGGYSSPSVST